MTANRVAANVPAGGNTGPPVTIARTGNVVTLANGVVTATIETTAAKVTSLLYKGRQMISQQGRHKTVYFFVVGDHDYEIAAPCAFSVTRQTPDIVDISCKRVYSPQNTNQHPWDLDTHFVLTRGASGLYVYSIANHPANYPDLNIGQYLMIWSMPFSDRDYLERIYVDEARHWTLPAPSDFASGEVHGIKEIVKLKTGIWKGRYDCKYMYNAPYWDLGCWGFASDRNRIGAWVVFGSHEFFNNGPTMSDLTSATGLLHVMFNMNHYGGTGLNVPKGESWQKVFGPILLYCNSAPAGADACWEDAKQQGDAEKAAWPYDWLKDNSAYPLKVQRGTITGRFVVKDSLKPNVDAGNAWVGLVQTDPTVNWQLDSKHYQYWERTDSRGTVSIPNVRPGTYTLHAFTTGAVGEFARTNVTVKAGEAANLGDIVWRVPHAGATLAWEIGVPDRTAKEFRHGDDYFQPLLWEKFPGEFSNPLEYTVGVSDWSKDWNYVHCGYPVGEKWKPWKWRIHFNLTNLPSTGNATLTLAYASSYYGRTEIYVNDESKQFGPTIRPPEDGGNALIREGIHAKYSTQQVSIPLSLLKKGKNTITLLQGGDRFDRAFYHVMYDYLSLEMPDTPK